MTDTLPGLVPAPRTSPEGRAGCRVPRPSSEPAAQRPSRGRTLVREVALLGVLMLVYQGSRLLGGRDVPAAFDHAHTVLEVERYLRLPAEQDVQALLLTVEPLVRSANGFYAAAHLPVTGLALLWLLWVLPETYLRTRRVLVARTGVALAVYLLLPVAPPRMLPGFVDTAAVHGQSVYGDAGASALANQYAALPSLHVGWAVLVALACITAGRSRWRWLWLVHPVVTVVVVVVTANHFWLDAAAGAAIVALAWHASGVVHRRRSAQCPLVPAQRGVQGEDEPVDELLQAWTRAVGAHPGAAAEGRELLARYDEPQRRYHDRRHLAEVLRALEELAPGSVPSTVLLAAFWHDAVYDPTAEDNEARSAALAEQVLGELGVSPSDVDEVVRLVRLTASHEPAGTDAAGALLSDADLAILGASPQRYRDYAQDVRTEYGHLSDEAFTSGRAAVLRGLVERPRLFTTEQAHRRWDDRARQNLQDELGRLGAGQPL